MEAVITYFMRKTGSEERAAADKWGALGPETEAKTYNMVLGAMHQIGKLALARLNFPVIS
jgi:hypothetical protein